MSWNYRVIKHEKLDGSWFSIHEVYYDDDGNPWACTEDPASPFGETEEELRAGAAMMMKAFEKPVLNYSSFNGTKMRKQEKVLDRIDG